MSKETWYVLHRRRVNSDSHAWVTFVVTTQSERDAIQDHYNNMGGWETYAQEFVTEP